MMAVPPAAWILSGGCLLAVARGAAASSHPVRTAVFGALSGMAALALMNLFSTLTGVSLPLNPATAFFAAVLGTPGVVLLLVLRCIFW